LMYWFVNLCQAAEACQLKLRSIGTKPEHISEGIFYILYVIIVS